MMLQPRSSRTLAFLASLVVGLGLIASPASAQYKITNLVSNQTGKAKHVDADLVNAWGMSFFSGGPFWISDEGSGLSTFYSGKGVKVGTVTIPGSTPTGQVANGTSDFVVTEGNNSGPALFIFDTFEPGEISGWNPSVDPNNAIAVVKGTGAWFTGLAIGQNGGANFIYAVDNLNNKVDIYDGSFTLTKSFTDTNLTGLKAYNALVINGQLYVIFADAANTKGAVDIFDTAGNFVKTLTKDKHLKGPWGIAVAPKNFGKASNDLLVSDLGDGHINAFNAKTGKFVTQLKGTNKKVLSIDGLWAIAFGEGGGQNGKSNQLFFTAGPNGYANGLFGMITAAK